MKSPTEFQRSLKGRAAVERLRALQTRHLEILCRFRFPPSTRTSMLHWLRGLKLTEGLLFNGSRAF
jgi:hypothetical protein